MLVGSAEEDGNRVVSVVMGEPTEAGRDADTVALLRYGLSRLPRGRGRSKQGETLSRAPIRFHEGDRVPLIAARSFSVTAPRGGDTEFEVRADTVDPLEGPLPAGAAVGGAEVYVNGDRRGRIVIKTGEPVPAPTLSTRAGLVLGRWIVPLMIGIVLIAGILVLVRSRTRRSRRPDRRAK